MGGIGSPSHGVSTSALRPLKWAILLCKTGRMSREGSFGGILDPYPTGVQRSLFARLGRADVEKYGFGKDWAAISYNIQWGVHLSLSKSSGLTVKKSWLPGSRRRPRSGCPWKGKMPLTPGEVGWISACNPGADMVQLFRYETGQTRTLVCGYAGPVRQDAVNHVRRGTEQH